jgi:autotransporter-associated beta strand protein
MPASRFRVRSFRRFNSFSGKSSKKSSKFRRRGFPGSALQLLPFPRSRLAEALLGALLSLQAYPAMASVCSDPVTGAVGTHSGSLYHAIQDGCVELSSSVTLPPYIDLSASVTANSNLPVYLDVGTSSQINYGLTQNLGTQFIMGRYSITYERPTSTLSNMSSVVLTTSYSPNDVGTPPAGYGTIIDSGTEVLVSASHNLSGYNIELNDTSGTNYVPTLGFGISGVSLAQSLGVYIQGAAGAIDTHGFTSTMYGPIEENPGSSSALDIFGAGSLQMGAGISTTGPVTLEPRTTLRPLTGSYSGPSQFVINGTLDLSSFGGQTDIFNIQSLAGDGSVFLGSGPTLLLSNAGGGVFSGIISGTGNLSLSQGTETLTRHNTFIGTTTIAPQATLILSGSGGLAASDVSDSGTLDISGTTSGAAVRSLSGGGAVRLGSQTLIVDGARGDFAGVISGQGGLSITGGTETLSNSNTYTGTTSISVGAGLALSGAGQIAASALNDNGSFDISAASGPAGIGSLAGSGTVSLGSNNLTINNASGTFAGVISGSGGLQINGGAQTLVGTNTFGGTTSIASSATLVLSGSGSLASSTVTDDGSLKFQQATAALGGSISGSGGVVVSGGTATLSGVSSYTGDTQIMSGSTLALTGAGSLGNTPVTDDGTLEFQNGTGSVAGAISGPGGVALIGSSATLSAASNYSGATSIDSASTLKLAGAGSIGSSAVSDNGTLDVSGASSAAVGSLQGTGSVNLGSANLIISSGSGTLGGTISGSGGVSLQAGTQTLSAAESYTGATSIAPNALLALTGSGSLAGSPVNVDGTLDISGTSSGAAVGSLSGGGGVRLGSQTLTLEQASSTFDGVIEGAGGLTIARGSAGLSGPDLYTGATTIDADATLALSGVGSISASPVVDNGLFDISQAKTGQGVVYLHSLSGSGNVNLGSNDLRLTQASGSLSGVISGNGGLQLAGGTQTLGGASTYSGATSISSGAVLALAGAGSIGASTVNDQGTLDISGSNGAAAVGNLQGSGSVTLGAQTLALEQASGSFAGTLSGSGGLDVRQGAWALTAAQGYTGTTTIGSSATLALSGAASLASSPVLDDGQLDVSQASPVAGAAVQLPSLSGSGGVRLGGNTLALTQASGVFAGQIAGSGVLELLAGQQELQGANTYTGGTNVEGGTLVLSHGAQLASGLQVQPGGSAQVPDSAAISGDVNNAGSLTVGDTQAVGVLKVGGSYTQGAGGTLVESVTPDAQSSLQVQGPHVRLGGKLVVDVTPGRYLRRVYTLVQAPSGSTLAGEFSSLQIVSPGALQAQYLLQYITDPEVLLTVSATDPFSSLALTPNQREVARVLDGSVASAAAPLYDRLHSLLHMPLVLRGLNAIDGELYSSTPSWVLQGTQQEWGRLFDRLGLGTLSYAVPHYQAFAFVDASHGRLLGDGNADGQQQSSSALTLGRQIRRGAWNLGAAVGTLTLGATRVQAGDGMMASLYRAGVFAGRSLGAMRIGGVLGYTQGDVAYGMGRRSVRVVSAQSRLARNFKLPHGNVLTPLLSLDAQSLRLGQAGESDPFLGLQVPRQNVDEFSSLAALREVHAWHWGMMHGDASASLGLRHWWHRPPSRMVLSFNAIPGANFTDWAVAAPRNMLEASLGLHARLRKNLTAQLAYQGEMGRSLRVNAIELHLLWNF